jgi:hypothetical protein
MTAILAANAARRTAIRRPTQITLVGRNIGVRSGIKIAAQSGGDARACEFLGRSRCVR